MTDINETSINSLHRRYLQAKERIEKLEAALRFYGDKHHWRKQHHRDLNKDFWTFAAQDDGGKIARKALEGKE
jgi:prophage maintenance system killer protein